MSNSVSLHHINVPAYDVQRMGDFYQQILGLKEYQIGRVQGSFQRESIVLEADYGQIHLTRPIPALTYQIPHPVNPVLRGHIAFRVSDVDRIKSALAQAQMPFSDFGQWAVKGWHQVFFYDPEGNVVEVHQIK